MDSGQWVARSVDVHVNVRVRVKVKAKMRIRVSGTVATGGARRQRVNFGRKGDGLFR